MHKDRFSVGEHGSRVNVFRNGKRGGFCAAWQVDGIAIKRSLKTNDSLLASERALKIAGDLKSRNGELYFNPMLYIVQRGEDGPIKIGITTNIEARLKTIRTMIPEKVEVIGIYK